MTITDEAITAWVKNIIFQNKRAKLIFAKIVNMCDIKEDNFKETDFTVIGKNELQVLKNAQKKLSDIKDLASNMVKSLGTRGNIEKKE